jgi:phage baseplate assembly protein W
MKPAFTSIQHPVRIDAGLGRLAREEGYARHVEQLMRQVLLTNPGERVNRPDFGCGLRRMIFAPNSRLAASLAQVAIYEALQRWLAPVIRVDTVEAAAREETLEIRIAYTLKVRQERRYLNLQVTL